MAILHGRIFLKKKTKRSDVIERKASDLIEATLVGLERMIFIQNECFWLDCSDFVQTSVAAIISWGRWNRHPEEGKERPDCDVTTAARGPTDAGGGSSRSNLEFILSRTEGFAVCISFLDGVATLHFELCSPLVHGGKTIQCSSSSRSKVEPFGVW